MPCAIDYWGRPCWVDGSCCGILYLKSLFHRESHTDAFQNLIMVAGLI